MFNRDGAGAERGYAPDAAGGAGEYRRLAVRHADDAVRGAVYVRSVQQEGAAKGQRGRIEAAGRVRIKKESLSALFFCNFGTINA